MQDWSSITIIDFNTRSMRWHLAADGMAWRYVRIGPASHRACRYDVDTCGIAMLLHMHGIVDQYVKL